MSCDATGKKILECDIQKENSGANYEKTLSGSETSEDLWQCKTEKKTMRCGAN